MKKEKKYFLSLRRKVIKYTEEYKQFSKLCGLKTDNTRISVYKYHSIKS